MSYKKIVKDYNDFNVYKANYDMVINPNVHSKGIQYKARFRVEVHSLVHSTQHFLVWDRLIRQVMRERYFLEVGVKVKIP